MKIFFGSPQHKLLTLLKRSQKLCFAFLAAGGIAVSSANAQFSKGAAALPLLRLALNPSATYHALLLDSDNLDPGFFKSLSSPHWRRITQYKLDNQLPYHFFGRFTFSSNLFLNAALMPNYHISAELLKESAFAPGITVGAVHAFSLPTSSLISGLAKQSALGAFLGGSDDVFDYEVHLVSASILFSKSVSPSTKIYLGPRYTYEHATVKVVGFDIGQVLVQYFPEGDELINGIGNALYRRKHSAQMVFGFTQLSTTKEWANSFTAVTDFDKNMAFLFEASFKKNWILGVAIDPFGILTVRPYFKFRVRFPW